MLSHQPEALSILTTVYFPIGSTLKITKHFNLKFKKQWI